MRRARTSVAVKPATLKRLQEYRERIGEEDIDHAINTLLDLNAMGPAEQVRILVWAEKHPQLKG